MPVRPRRPAPLVLLPILFAAIAAAPHSVFSATCGSGDTSLGNGGFETPGVPAGDYNILDASQVPPWSTTDVSNGIEIWGDWFQGIPAAEGANFAELNANSAGTLYQDVVTTPGATMTWTLRHRGRDGIDVMKVLIGDALTADVWSDAGWNAISDDISDGWWAWGAASDTYVVPAGQTCTRFAFRAVSSGVGIASYGNFLDDIGFVVTIPAEPTPEPTPDPTPDPTPEPTPAPTPETTPDAAPTPDAPPTPASPPTPGPSPTLAPAPAVASPTPAGVAAATREPRITPPPTDTAFERPHPDRGASLAALLAIWLTATGPLTVLVGRRLVRTVALVRADRS